MAGKQDGLRAKRPLTAKKPLRANTRPKKQAKPAVTPLKKEATKWFNKAVKFRDSEFKDGSWIFNCITCNKEVLFSYLDDIGNRRYMKNAHAGHFQPETRNATRYNEMNVNGQCGSCNFNQGEQYKYAKALDLKYGDGTADSLEEEAKESHQFTVDELQEIIADSKTQVEFYLTHY